MALTSQAGFDRALMVHSFLRTSGCASCQRPVLLMLMKGTGACAGAAEAVTSMQLAAALQVPATSSNFQTLSRLSSTVQTLAALHDWPGSRTRQVDAVACSVRCSILQLAELLKAHALQVYVSRVGDGICDCCDGSDEDPQ